MAIDKALAVFKTDLCDGPFSPSEAFMHEINLLGTPLSNLTWGKCSFQAGIFKKWAEIYLEATWHLADRREKGI